MTWRNLVFALFFTLCPALVSAQKKVSDEALHRPTATPDRVILTWAGDPATSQAVTWRSDTSVKQALAEIAVADDGPKFTESAKQVAAVTTMLKSDLGKAHYHSVKFEGLAPATLYAYRVGDGNNWSEWHQFRTASRGAAPLTFLYVGDAQNNILSLWSRLIRMGYAYAPMANFIIHAGDLVNRANRDADWGEWFRAASWINATIPSIPAPGNHEYFKAPEGSEITKHWRPQFTLPENGVPGLEETSYFLDIQGVRVITLNSNRNHKEQAEWMERVLANNPNKWTVATFHHPVFSTARGRDNKDLRAAWQPVFDKFGVDLVLTGHDHTYGRSNVTTGMGARSEKAGTVYVVSVSGPKMYKLEKQDWMVSSAQDMQLFQVIRIDGDRLLYESRTARGLLHDSFELIKRPGKPNEIRNRKLEITTQAK